MSSTLPVIIVGAGVSGLALAQGLSKEGIPFKVYESDASLDARTQGYRVRIGDEGIDALKQHLSQEHFARVSGCCNIDPGPSNVPQRNLDAHTAATGQSLFKPGAATPLTLAPGSKPMSVDRGMLRRVLIEGIDDRVFFGCRFRSYTSTSEHIIAHFEDGSQVQGSLVVGADGVWSRVRRQRTPSSPLLDTEARLVFGKTDLSEEVKRELSNISVEGLTFVRGSNGLACLLEPMHFPKDSKPDTAADYVYWVLFMHCDNTHTPANILSLNADECAALSREATSTWHPSLRALFDQANKGGTSALQILTANPDQLSCSQAPSGSESVTLIGDAAHTMPPTGAAGASTALRDSLVLLTSLKQHGVRPEALVAYETSMVTYASETIRKSLLGGKAAVGMKSIEDLPVISPSSQGTK